ncbi:Trans-zeatin O-beta-D-glucosyltransferase [Bertholletia excelsa]
MLDLVKLAAGRGVKASVITSPENLPRFRRTLPADLPIHLLEVDVDLDTDGQTENPNSTSSPLSSSDAATRTLAILHPLADDLVRCHRPDAIISDLNLPWTAQISRKYGIPRIVFHSTSCFALCISQCIGAYRPHEGVNSDYEAFPVPGLPEPVHITKSDMPTGVFNEPGLQELFGLFAEADQNTYGAVMANTFSELEPKYVEHFEKSSKKKVWPVGPVSLCNMVERGNRSSIDKDRCLTWLDGKQSKSVIYVCFGSLCVFTQSQLVEIGLGLEASNCNFIWVIRDISGAGTGADEALRELEERVKGRGRIIKGWAPQVLILNHPAVGGFVTHCGWNSVVEAVVAGVPMVTWPLANEQFYNQIFVLEQLKIGIGIGVNTRLKCGEKEEAGAIVKRGRVAEVVAQLMGGGEMVREMQERASTLSELARAAVKEGGSSYLNLEDLIEDLLRERASGKAYLQDSNA